ncbi:MAG: 30S ribosomal protein S9 [Opitutales bacterium]|nr:30S ribosomal protein S9 [Opitutales bacterium]
MSDTAETATVLTAVGRRKTATSRVRLSPGGAEITVNNKPFEEFFPTELLQKTVLRPLEVAEKKGEISLRILVNGGGPHGQASAASLGVARALLKLDPELRGALKKDGLLRRDPRERERKKPGQPGARKRFQFSKR